MKTALGNIHLVVMGMLKKLKCALDALVIIFLLKVENLIVKHENENKQMQQPHCLPLCSLCEANRMLKRFRHRGADKKSLQIFAGKKADI